MSCVLKSISIFKERDKSPNETCHPHVCALVACHIFFAVLATFHSPRKPALWIMWTNRTTTLAPIDDDTPGAARIADSALDFPIQNNCTQQTSAHDILPHSTFSRSCAQLLAGTTRANSTVYWVKWTVSSTLALWTHVKTVQFSCDCFVGTWTHTHNIRKLPHALNEEPALQSPTVLAILHGHCVRHFPALIGNCTQYAIRPNTQMHALNFPCAL